MGSRLTCIAVMRLSMYMACIPPSCSSDMSRCDGCIGDEYDMLEGIVIETG